MAWGQRYRDRDALRTAVLEIARAGWRKAAGRDLSKTDEENFRDQNVPEHERRAIEVSDSIAMALSAAAAFVRDYGESWKELRPRTATLTLMGFLGLHMRQPIDGPFRTKDGSPSIVSIIEKVPTGWAVEIRDRIVILLRDRLSYWKDLGLKEPASNRTMAFASLLLDNGPRITDDQLKKGITAAEVIRRETAAIRAARSRVDKLIAGSRK